MTSGTVLGNLISRLKVEEGFRAKSYRDSLGHLTIGYGTLLEGAFIDKRLSALGLSPTMVRAGSWPITETQGLDLLYYDAGCAMTDAGDVVGRDAWMRLPDTAKLVCADMTYQLGSGGFAGFHHMLAALRLTPPDYAEAAHQMLNSEWHMQTKERCEALSSLMKSLVPQPPPAAAA